MPKWSRARVSRFSSRSQMARPNIPLNRSKASGPHCANAWSTTSVSESVVKVRPSADELLAQVEVVVDLAVVRDRVAPVGGVHRLLAVRDVDDRQPPVGQAARAARDDALTVRPAVLLAVVHPLQQRVVGVESVVAGDAAHALSWVLVLGGGAHGIRVDAEAPACHGCRVRPIRVLSHRGPVGGSGGQVRVQPLHDVGGDLVAVGLVEDLVPGTRVERAGHVGDARPTRTARRPP